LMKMNSNGKIEWTRQYGTDEDENVSLLFYDGGIVYFGGEFAGDKAYRKLGNYYFINPTLNHDRAYISMMDPDLNVSQLYSSSDSTTNEVLDETKLLSYDELATVYPNPFKNSFTIDIHSKEITRMEIVNTLNQSIERSKTNGKSIIDIELKNNPAGLYMINFYD